MPDPSYGMTFNDSTLTDRDSTFLVPAGVDAVRGGFRVGQSVSDIDPQPLGSASLLSGEIGIEGLSSDNCFHTVVIDNAMSQAVVEFHDLIVADGYADDRTHPFTAPPQPGSFSPPSSPPDPGLYNALGGGVLALDGSVKFIDCVLRDNYAVWGGGLFASGGFVQNNGGNVESLRLTVRDNLAGENGGGFYANRGIQVILGNSLFRGNDANYDGGALFRRSALVDFEVNNSVLHDNYAARQGGAIYCEGTVANQSEAAQIVNCTIAHNDAEEGAGLYFGPGFEASSGDTMTVFNTIVFQNPPGDNDDNVVVDSTSIAIAQNSFLGAPTGAALGTTIIAQGGGAPTIFDAGAPGSPLVPGWVDGAARDYRLKLTSTCVDEGDDFLLRDDRVDADDDTDESEAYPREYLMADEAFLGPNVSTREVPVLTSGTPVIGNDGGEVDEAICDIGAFEYRLIEIQQDQ